MVSSQPRRAERGVAAQARQPLAGVHPEPAGSFDCRRRSVCGVSPVRIATLTARNGSSSRFANLCDADQRCPQVAFDIVNQGFQRRDVEHTHAGLGPRRQAAEPIDAGQERGQRLPLPVGATSSA